MKLPFFRSKKKIAKEAEAEQLELTAQVAKAAEPEAPATAAKQTKPRRVPAELVVESIGYVLAAVPSLGPTVKAWRKLGFHVGEPYTWLGCNAADIELENGGLRFLAADPHAESTPLSEIVRERLVLGSGLFGWTWQCSQPHRSAIAIGQLAGKEFHTECEDWGDELVQIPVELTPTAATWLEAFPTEQPERPAHANSITRLDHIVLQASQSKSVSQTFEKHFGLKGRTSAMNDRYYAFLKVGSSELEIVGPLKPGTGDDAPRIPSSGRIVGGPWGMAFGSTNIDATITFLRMAGVEVSDPHKANQGGRITGMSAPLGGIQLAFMGD